MGREGECRKVGGRMGGLPVATQWEGEGEQARLEWRGEECRKVPKHGHAV